LFFSDDDDDDSDDDETEDDLKRDPTYRPYLPRTSPWKTMPTDFFQSGNDLFKTFFK
jgi:hypothetical protein